MRREFIWLETYKSEGGEGFGAAGLEQPQPIKDQDRRLSRTFYKARQHAVRNPAVPVQPRPRDERELGLGRLYVHVPIAASPSNG